MSSTHVLTNPLISIIVRTLNEERYLPDLLDAIATQSWAARGVEVIIVDSGSTDRTREIATAHQCAVVTISRAEFTFGRSLNLGCSAASGEYLVFVSGHCVPARPTWLEDLVSPLIKRDASYTYGRQIGTNTSQFSEKRLFEKYFQCQNRIPQQGIFCNNANAALPRAIWYTYRFNEDLTGLEDMELGSRLVRNGHHIGYVASATVYHIHQESWRQVRLRYEREAIALQFIMPEVHLSLLDAIRYILAAIWRDTLAAARMRVMHRELLRIIAFRTMQFWGAFRGNHEHRQLSRAVKDQYFYPT